MPSRFATILQIGPVASCVAVLTLTASAVGIEPAAPLPRVDCDFPGGNIIMDAIDGDTIRLHQDLRDTRGDWFYWYFRVRGAAGRTLSFQFPRGNVIGVRGPAVSLDEGESWTWLGTAAVNDTSFRYAFAPDADEVPLIAFATIAGMPWSILDAHAPASPVIGAPATPTSWQILQN